MPVKKKKLIPPAQREAYKQEQVVENAIKEYNKRDLRYVAVYGIDEDTTKFLHGIWENTNITKVVAVDPSPERLSTISKVMSGKRFSMNRWYALQSIGFFSEARWPLVVVSEEEYHKVRLTRKAKGIKVRTLKQLSEGKFG